MTAVHSKLRRYPALGFLAVAALLASLLPSALRVPLSGPTASAELAPVPGESDSAQGDLSALGQTSTGGLGSGSGIGGLGSGGRGGPGPAPEIDQPPPPDDNGRGRNPSNKRCVGKPPRQTEDPLSPACVAYFKGDNFGATSKGVTREEIVVVDLSDSCSGEFRVADYEDSSTWFPEFTDTPGHAALVRYFNDRYQMYGRRVHVYQVRGGAGASGTCPKARMQEVEERLHPFAIVANGLGGLGPEGDVEAARLGTIVSLPGASRELAQANTPYLISFIPDLEDRAANVVEAVCARLAGRTARFAADPGMHGTVRKFGIVYFAQGSDPDNLGVRLVADGIERRCGDRAGDVEIGYVQGTGESRQQAAARMKLAGVTTVLMAGSQVFPQEGAQAVGWYPEWLEFGSNVGNNGNGRGYPPAEYVGALGLMDARRLGPPTEHNHRRAAAEGGCAGCRVEERMYNHLLLLATGIQAAGPRLTPANFDKGLRALPARQSTDPFAPSAYFAPGNHSFVKDFAMVWWDSTGIPPGTSTPGCWRLVEDGLRYRAQDWQKRPGDEGIKGDGQPCQGDR